MAELTGKEIVAIIRAGKEAQIAKFELGTLKIQFSGTADEIAAQPTSYHTNSSTAVSETPEVHTQSLLHDLDEHLLNLTDPVGFERKLILNEEA